MDGARVIRGTLLQLGLWTHNFAPDFTFSVQPTEIVYEYHKTINGVTQNFKGC
jgi:hypothetical protein